MESAVTVPESDSRQGNHHGQRGPRGNAVNLAKELRRILRSMRWQRIHDFGPVEGVFPETDAPVLDERANVDLAVLALDRKGELVDAANVVVTRDQPQGLISDLDPNLGTKNITWQRWDQGQWDGNRAWISSRRQLPAKDLIQTQKRLNGNAVFMSPYPASLFKLPLAFFLLEDVSDQRIELSDIRRDLRKMLTVSSNQATQDLLKYLHENDRIGAMNSRFRQLGLGTIQIKGTDSATGGGWKPGRITMTSMDTAKLLWLIQSDPSNPAPWSQPNGSPVQSKLTEQARRILRNDLGNQAFNETLSTANFGAADINQKIKPPQHIEPGIPNHVPDRWIDNITGFVTIESDGERINFGEDVRPYNKKAASKNFLHKTGITYNFGSDAGIVEPSLGSIGARYIISFISNLGYRYIDEPFADRQSYPFEDNPGPIAHTQEIPRLGQRVNQLMDTHFNGDAGN